MGDLLEKYLHRRFIAHGGLIKLARDGVPMFHKDHGLCLNVILEIFKEVFRNFVEHLLLIVHHVLRK